MAGDTISDKKSIADSTIEPMKHIAGGAANAIGAVTHKASETMEPVKELANETAEPVTRIADTTLKPIRFLTRGVEVDDLPELADITTREKIVVRTSLVGIVANVLLSSVKALLGYFTGSIAITLDAVNNLTDAMSSVVTIIGTKLAGREPDKNHPFGYGRIEYLTTMIIAAIILYAGLTAFFESVNKIMNPSDANYSAVSLVVMFIAILMKLALGRYFKTVGKKVHSGALIASGQDALYDSLLSTSVLVSALIFMAFGVSLEAYVGILIAIFISKAGIELIIEALNDILGTRADNELVDQIKTTICNEEPVLGAYDLILHSYGPNRIVASVHVEVPGDMNAMELDSLQRRITRKVAEEHRVLMSAVGVYTVDSNPEAKAIREDVLGIVKAHEGVIQAHGFRVDLDEKVINLDIIIDFNMKDRIALFNEIRREVEEKYPDYRFEPVLDIDT